MLVSFEGLDGSGKSTLLAATSRELASRGIECGEVPELSEAASGERLRSLLKEDKFLRPGEGSDALTRSLEIVADLYALDASLIRPMDSRGLVVLKDRHVGTVLSCQMPVLESAGLPTDSAFGWLTSCLSLLSAWPDLTFLVHASQEARVHRIERRRRQLEEAAGNVVSEEDLVVFAERERWYGRLSTLYPERIVDVENEGDDPDRVAEGIADLVVARMVRRS